MATFINLVILLFICSVLILFWGRIAVRGYSVIITSGISVVGLGIAILAVPLLWTSEHRLFSAGIRVAALASGFALLISGVQLRRPYQVAGVYLTVGGAVVQALIAIQQLLLHRDAWVPLYGARVYGSFFQPNVLASYLATGLALAWGLFLLPYFANSCSLIERGRKMWLLLMMFFFSALLILIQSRVGWLGGLSVIGLYICLLGRAFPHGSRQASFAVVGGGAAGLGVLFFESWGVTSINHSQSNTARWSMLRDTLAMIADRPWQGWGYGGFEYDFQHFRINQAPATKVTEIASHPHNELLLWMSEGGVIAASGLALLLVGIAGIVCRARYRDRIALAMGTSSAGIPTALCIALVPIALHTQFEFPFYLSALHALTFLFLLSVLDRFGSNRRQILSPRRKRQLACGMVIFTVCGGFVAGFSLQGNLALTQVERFGMEDVAPLGKLPASTRWLLQERLTFDQQVNALLTYNHTRDEKLLTQYRQWAELYLQKHIDKNVYASLIMILRHQKNLGEAERYRRDAERFFPNDLRFVSPHGEDK